MATCGTVYIVNIVETRRLMLQCPTYTARNINNCESCNKSELNMWHDRSECELKNCSTMALWDIMMS